MYGIFYYINIMLTSETQTITHITQSGSNYIEYVVSHYLEKVPDKVKVYKKESNVWLEIDRLGIGDGGSPEEGYYPLTTTGIGDISIRIYRINESDISIKIVCLDLS